MAWKQYRSYDYPDPEKFKQYRKTIFGNEKSVIKCAKWLYVSERTIQAWESGTNKIPYATFKLLRMKATGRLMDSPEFEGFHVQDGTIYNAANQGFDHAHLKWIQLYMQIARRAIEDYKTVKFIRSISREENDLMKRLKVRYKKNKNNRSESYKKRKSKIFY